MVYFLVKKQVYPNVFLDELKPFDNNSNNNNNNSIIIIIFITGIKTTNQ